MCAVVFTVDVNVVGMEEKVLGAEEGVGEGAVGGVYKGGEGEGFCVCGFVGMFVWVVEGLDVQEFAAQE